MRSNRTPYLHTPQTGGGFCGQVGGLLALTMGPWTHTDITRKYYSSVATVNVCLGLIGWHAAVLCLFIYVKSLRKSRQLRALVVGHDYKEQMSIMYAS